jgi:hypothetical protein
MKASPKFAFPRLIPVCVAEPPLSPAKALTLSAADGEQIRVDGGCIGQGDGIPGTADGKSTVDSEEVLNGNIERSRSFDQRSEVAVEVQRSLCRTRY